jgi:hypothetical protein
VPYDIREEGNKFAIYRTPYPGETGEEEKVAEADTMKDAEMYVSFASRKEDEPTTTKAPVEEAEDTEEEEET